MSDILAPNPLLAAAPVEAIWADHDRLPLAVLPCLGGTDLFRRTPFRTEEP